MNAWLLELAVGLTCLAADSPKGNKPAEKPAPAPFKVSLRKSEDTVGTWIKGDVAVISLKCPSGIGSATITRQEKQWPKVVVLYLHLKGLEDFRAGNGQDTLHAAVRVGDGEFRMRQWKNRQEGHRLLRTDPLRLNICAMNLEGKPVTKAPLNEGYFEITLPSVFFGSNPKSISLHWIDFFR